MNTIQELLSDKKYSLRTQICLSQTLRQEIDKKRRLEKESLADYIRKSVAMRIIKEEREKSKREKIANEFIGSIPKDKYPEWSTMDKIIKWQREMRKDKE